MSGPDQDYDATYAYDTKGRLNQVLGPGVDTTNGVRYERFSDSDAVQYVRYKDSNNANVLTTQREYASNRDVLDWVENRINGDPDTTVSKYDYVLDTTGRRTAVVMTGTAFDDYGNHHWAFLYNDRSELTDADRKTGTTVGSGTPFGTKGVFDYLYDPIGNRTSTVVDTATRYYCVDADSSGYSVNKYLTIDDESSCPPTSAEESFTYDDDGNLTSDERYTYTWDAENRLIQIVTTREGDPAWRDKKLTFKYDYMGRRVEKVYYIANTSHEWVIYTHERFVYDDWNPVLVLNGQDSNAVLRKYTWGLDLSGLAGNGTVSGIHGAGGINGLLACVDSFYEVTAWYFYDGNGNVVQLVDPSDPDGTLHAKYEYDAYGNTLAESGGYYSINPIQFSTKYRDLGIGHSTFKGAVGNTGLYYYGHRYYAPRIGRWMSRDPIGEQGGLNLYGFVGNNPINMWDIKGLKGTCCGVDITENLENLLVSLAASLRALSQGHKKQLCYALANDPVKGWDIDELYNTARRYPGYFEWGAWGKNWGEGRCANTVTIGGGCYHPGEANYLLFGWGNHLCNEAGIQVEDRFNSDSRGYPRDYSFTLEQMKDRVFTWRFVRSAYSNNPGWQDQIQFAINGYLGGFFTSGVRQAPCYRCPIKLRQVPRPRGAYGYPNVLNGTLGDCSEICVSTAG